MNVSKFRGNNKWSSRLKQVANMQSIMYSDELIKKIKIKICDIVYQSKINCISENYLEQFMNICERIEKNLDNTNRS